MQPQMLPATTVRQDDLADLINYEAFVRLQAGQDAKAQDLRAAADYLSSEPERFAASREADRDAPAYATEPRILSRIFAAALREHQAGSFGPAKVLYRAILALDPTQAMVWSNIAGILVEEDRLEQAIEHCENALALEPGHLNAQLNKVIALRKSQAYGEAVQILRRLNETNPAHFEFRKLLAETLQQTGQNEAAIAALNEWLAIAPDSPEALRCKAELFKVLNRVDEAIFTFRKLVEVAPKDAEALSNLGLLIGIESIANDLVEAADLCLRAALLQPNDPAIINNFGVILRAHGDNSRALLVFRQLVELAPHFASAHCNIGSILGMRSQYDEAADAFSRTLECQPGMPLAEVELAVIRQRLCKWDSYESDCEAIRKYLYFGPKLIALMVFCKSAAEQLSRSKAAMAPYTAAAKRVQPRRPNKIHSRIRIGYISADFKDHPVGHLIPEMLTRHNRTSFEIFGFSLGQAAQTKLRARLVAAFDHFVDCERLTDADVAQRIEEHEVDILVDLTGPTAGARFPILARKPAPIQVAYLGLPGTSGAECMDYIIADHFLIPDTYGRFYQEKVVRLPFCYQPSDNQRWTPIPIPSRAQCGLPESGFVFCSFNSSMKITPEIFQIWLRLLEAVEGSVLWLYSNSRGMENNLRRKAEQQGVDPNRLIFAPALQFDPYIARLHLADLFLDCHPYGAGATCNDALMAGLPLLTCVGETYTSRMAGSLLTAIGVPELITYSLVEYERLAVHLATNPGALASLKEKLKRLAVESRLFNMQEFTQDLESAYEAMLSRWHAGLSPTHIDVERPAQKARALNSG